MSEPAKPYDLFISYAQEDRAWVEGYLLDALTQAGVRCHSEAAFELGVPRVLQFERAVQGSRRTLLVLSPAYLAEGFAQFADLLAQTYGVETGTWPVIPLLLRPVPLPPRLSMLVALDATDPGRRDEAITRLCKTLQRPVPGPAPCPACPYPGMVPFRAKDARFFYGREGEIREMLQHLRHQRRLFVIGPSGCGKSSLIFAGLLPKLAESTYFPEGFWLVREMRPGAQPWQTLSQMIEADPGQPAAALAGVLSAHPPAQRLLLVIDQFEELFTQTQRTEQSRFIAALHALAGMESCALLIGMRADFYPDLMNSDFWPVEASQRLELAPLRDELLRQAIERPAQDVGVCVEGELVQRLLDDAADEPGVLPLLQETMVLLWAEMQRRFLPLSAYERLGGEGRSGLAVAIATKADATLSELSPARQAIARRIFLRLIQFGEGRPDMRRQQSVAALRSAADNPDEFNRTLEHLTGNRLLTLSGEEKGEGRKVDIAHEALIRGWPMLRDWLGQKRAAELTRRRLDAKAEEWVRLRQGGGGLLDDVELREAEGWLASPDADEVGCSEELPKLVHASRIAIEEAARETEAVHQRELEQAKALLDEQRRRAEDREKAAQEARELQRRAAQQAHLARAGQLASKAQDVLEARPLRGLLLAMEALAVTAQANEPRVAAAEAALRQALANCGGLVMGGHEGCINAVAMSRDGHWLVTGSEEGTGHLWDLTAADPAAAPIVLRGHKDSIRAVAMSPDSHWLATGSQDHTACLWNLTAPDPAAAPIVLRSHKDGISAVAISPDGHWLVTAGWDNTARLWDLTAPDPAAAPIVLRGHKDSIRAVAMSPDSHWLAAGSQDHTARLWDLTAPDPAAAPIVLRGHEDAISAVAIHPDSHWLVTGSQDYTARLWDLSAADPAAAPIVLRGHEGPIWAVAISADGHWLVTGSDDHTARLWDLTAPDPAAAPIVLRGHEGSIDNIAISPDGHWLVTGSDDHTARLWDLTAPDPAAVPIILRGHENGISAVATSPDGHWLVTGSEDSTARLWDLTADPAAAPIVLRGHQDWITDVAISPDGHWLVTGSGNLLEIGSQDYTARLWNLAAPHPAAAPIILRGHEGPIWSVAISPDSHWLVTGSGHFLRTSSEDKTARLWNLTAADPAAAPIVLRGHAGAVWSVAISRDGHLLVTGSLDGTARLWNLTALDPAAAPIVLRGHEAAIYAIAISPDGHWLVTGSHDNTARLWDLTAPDPAAAPIVLRGHEGAIDAVAISAAGHWLATGSKDGTARLWDLTAPDPAAAPIVLRGHEDSIWAVAISPGGHWLVTGSADTTARLWDLTAPDPAAVPIILRGHEEAITDVAISPDGHCLVTGSDDGTARLWDLTAPNPAAAPIVLRGHEGSIDNIAISADNHWLVTGSRDRTARLWSLRLDELLDLACRTAGRNLTKAEWEQYFPGDAYRKTCAQWPEGN